MDGHARMLMQSVRLANWCLSDGGIFFSIGDLVLLTDSEGFAF